MLLIYNNINEISCLSLKNDVWPESSAAGAAPRPGSGLRMDRSTESQSERPECAFGLSHPSPLKSQVWACHGTVGKAVHHRRCRERAEIRGYIVGNADLQQSCGLVERANLQQAEMAAGTV